MIGGQGAMLRSGLIVLIIGHGVIQLEILAANEGAKYLALVDGELACLVLRPAIERRSAKALDLAPVALGNTVARIATAVVVADLGLEVGIVVTVDMHRERRRQAHADKPIAGRPAEAKSSQ